jgi:hypothetical protein
MPYILGNKNFKTKKLITEYFQSYHNANDSGTILDAEHHDVMFDLLKWHPMYYKWNILPISNIIFRLNIDDYGNKFYEYWHDGEWHSFSYLTCIKRESAAKYHKANCISAFRDAIRPQIRKFREDNHVCCNCGGLENIEVDHNYNEMPFKTLIQNFLYYTRTDYSDYELTSHYASGDTLSKEDSDKWESYHRGRAILRCLCRSCHQNKKK